MSAGRLIDRVIDTREVRRGGGRGLIADNAYLKVVSARPRVFTPLITILLRCNNTPRLSANQKSRISCLRTVRRAAYPPRLASAAQLTRKPGTHEGELPSVRQELVEVWNEEYSTKTRSIWTMFAQDYKLQQEKGDKTNLRRFFEISQRLTLLRNIHFWF